MNNIDKIKNLDTLPFLIEDGEVYYVQILDDSYNLIWLSEFFDITQVIRNVRTCETFYRVIRYYNGEITHIIINQNAFYRLFINKLIKYDENFDYLLRAYIKDIKLKANHYSTRVISY